MAVPANPPKPKREIWSTLLKGSSSGKHIIEKHLLLLGSTPEAQREFIRQLDTNKTHHSAKGNNVKHAPIANQIALGYTYQDVLDADQEDILARLSIYTLSQPSFNYIPLLKPIINPESVPNMAFVILLDWADPWSWAKKLRDWMRLLHSLLKSLPNDAVIALDENIEEWRDRRRNNHSSDSTSNTGDAANLDKNSTNISSSLKAAESYIASHTDVSLPLGPGEWELPLGVPLCIVCHNAQFIEQLEQDALLQHTNQNLQPFQSLSLNSNSAWKDRHFDFVQQFLRTILLKHGAGSLIYTMPDMTSPSTLETGGVPVPADVSVNNGAAAATSAEAQRALLQRFIFTSLSIRSMLLQKHILRHNITDRDRILVPVNYDSWGKIRILTTDFPLEEVSEAWSDEIESAADDSDAETSHARKLATPSAIAMYEAKLPPRSESLQDLYNNQAADGSTAGVKLSAAADAAAAAAAPAVEPLDTQAFLAKWAGELERMAPTAAELEAKKNSELNRARHHPLLRDSGSPVHGSTSRRVFSSGTPPPPATAGAAAASSAAKTMALEERIGPIRFDMGGAQVDADDLVKSIKERDAGRHQEPNIDDKKDVEDFFLSLNKNP